MEWEKLNFSIEILIYFLDFKWEYLKLKQKNLVFIDEIDIRYKSQIGNFQPIWKNLKIEWENFKTKIGQEIEEVYDIAEYILKQPNLEDSDKSALENIIEWKKAEPKIEQQIEQQIEKINDLEV